MFFNPDLTILKSTDKHGQDQNFQQYNFPTIRRQKNLKKLTMVPEIESK